MVNTFLVSADYEKSAATLDYRRLGKQRVEAMQILHYGQDLIYLGEEQGDPLPKELGKPRYDWVRRVTKRYKVAPHCYLVRYVDGPDLSRILYEIPRHLAKPIQAHKKRSKKDFMLTLADGTSFPVKSSDRLLTINPHYYHPCTQMWLDYEDSLKLYINAHIREWTKRGYQNTMTIYTHFTHKDFTHKDISSIKHPAWIYNAEFHKNHRAALMDKEITRQEKPWYIHRQEFTTAGPFVDYIWPTVA